jgi:hypothetical protein
LLAVGGGARAAGVAAGHPRAEGGGGELNCAPAGYLFEDAGVDVIHQLGGALTGEAGHLRYGDGERGFRLASFGGVTGNAGVTKPASASAITRSRSSVAC